jgi:DNA-binding transcriptional LysR family regulator
MKDLDLKTLRLLVAVCDHGSLKEAAMQAHIEPSAISKRISQLEETLGIGVLVRGRKGVELTTAGRTLIEHARTMLFTADRIEADVAAFRGGIRGQVHLAASTSAIAESLLDDLTVFMRDPSHADILVNIEERLSRDVVGMVRGGLASLGIFWSHVDFSGLERRNYRTDELILAVHPEHPLAARDAVRFEDTLDHEHVGMPPVTAVYTMLHKAAARAGRPIKYRVVVSNFDGAFRVVGANLGVSVVPKEVASLYAAAGQIKTVRLLNDWATRQFVVCFRRLEDLTPAARKLLDFLCAAAHADATPPPGPH